jgi:hypothetical protein
MDMISLLEQHNTEYLQELFITFAERFFALLEEWTKSNDIPQEVYPYIQFTDDLWQQGFKVRPNFAAFVRNLDNSLWNMPESVQCAKEHWTQGLLPSPEISDSAGLPIKVTTFEQVQWGIVRELLSPILDVLNQYGSSKPSREQILASYHHWREWWSAIPGAIGRWEVSIPLFNVHCDLQQAQAISSQLQLAPFTNEEKSNIWNSSIFPQPFMGIPISFDAFRQVKFKLTGSRTRLQGGLEDGQDIPTECDDIITALRLLKGGDVGAIAFFDFGRLVCGPMTSSMSRPLALQLRQYGTQYDLTAPDLPEVRALCSALQSLGQQKKGLSFALRRFNQSYGRDLPEDRITDLTFALDSCLFETKETELRYRFSLRGASMLASTRSAMWKPSQSQSFLLLMYDCRSAIVHSGRQLADLRGLLRKLEGIGLQPDQFPHLCEDIVREILLAYVRRLAAGQSKQSIIRDLDDTIVDSLTAKFYTDFDT